jgi:SAM-dependent methyltransferase
MTSHASSPATSPSRDQRAFRDFEQAGWKQAAGGYHDHIASLTSQAVPSLLEAAGVRKGTRLLDTCTGPGDAAGGAAERGANSTGMDFSAPMITLARRRFPQSKFLVGDAEALPFRKESLDAVISNFGVLHLARPDQFLREAHRVLRRGGLVAFTVWAPPEDSVAFGMVHHAVQTHGNPSVPLPPGPPFFRFSDASECIRTFRSLGFADSEVIRVPQQWRVKDSDGVFQAMMAGTVRTGGLLRAQTPEALAAIREAIRGAVESLRHEDVYELPMPAVLASAVKP